MAPFTICSVGCGSWAREAHGPSLVRYRQDRSEVRLAACCDVEAARARRFRDDFGYGAHYTDMEAMLAAEKPSAVSLAVQPAATAALAARIIARGVPVILEKPPGLTAEETRSIIEATVRAGVPTRVAFNRRYMPLVARLVQLMRAEGNPFMGHIHLDFYRVGRTDADFSTTAIHAVDLVRFLAGADYAAVSLSYGSHPRPAIDDVFLDCTFVSGCTGRISICPGAGVAMERLAVSGGGTSTSGSDKSTCGGNWTFLASLPGQGGEDPPGGLVQYVNGKQTATVGPEDEACTGTAVERNGFYAENAGFFDDLRAGRKPPGGVEDALQSVEIAECIRKRETLYKG
jgi:myo-inositol 2-dehydrogenase / D-chiro-inositol 1-dehydrogenase